MHSSRFAAFFAGALVLFAQKTTDIGHLVASDLQAGKYAQARELVQHALKESPRDPRLWTLNGLTLVRLQNKDEALAAFRRALEISPDYLPALEGAAEIEYEAGKEDAVPLLRRILKTHPDDQTSHAMLSAIAFKQGDCETARSEYAESQPYPTRELGALEEFGSCLVKQKRTHEAVPVFQRLSELQPGNEKALYDLAVVQFLTGQYRNVITTLDSAATRESPDADVLDLLGEAYEAVSETERALGALRRAIGASPKVSRYYADLAYVCLTHGYFQQGIETLDAGLRQSPDAASLYVVRGVLYSELAQYEKGLSDFKTAEKLDPNVELGSEARGLADLQRNDLPEAEKTVRERIRLHPNDAFLYYLLAETLRKKGAAPGSAEFEEATKALRKAVDLKPEFDLARDLLGALYLEEGKTDEAIEQSRVVYRANPADETALYHLILALRKSNQTHEIPELVNELAQLKKRSRAEESLERKYAVVDHAPAEQATIRVKQ